MIYSCENITNSDFMDLCGGFGLMESLKDLNLDFYK